MKKEKIFVSAYGCEPNKGSEIGVGWHWIVEMSKYFELWVMTRASNKQNIENYLTENPIKSEIHFVYFDLPGKLRFWKKGLRGVRLYYNLWQIFSDKLVKKTMIENNIGTYHLLTYGNAFWKASNYGTKQRFIWGPTGGMDTIPTEFSKRYGTKQRFLEFVRRWAVKTIRLNGGFQKKCKRADIIFCKTGNMYNAISDKYKNKAMVFTDVAVEKRDIKEIKRKSITKYVAAGRLDGWRGFDILIEAFNEALRENGNIALEILGEGNDRKRLEKIIAKHGLGDKVSLTGKVGREVYEKKMEEADVVVNPNLKEGGVTVAFDSIAFGKPLICIDTGGYTRNFSHDSVCILSMQSSKLLIGELKKSILFLSDSDNRKEMWEKILKEQEKLSWEQKGREIFNIIDKLL